MCVFTQELLSPCEIQYVRELNGMDIPLSVSTRAEEALYLLILNTLAWFRGTDELNCNVGF